VRLTRTDRPRPERLVQGSDLQQRLDDWETDHVIEGAADAPDIACGDHLFGGPLGVGAVSAEAHYDCMTMRDLVAIYPRSRCCPS
jgi:hypothetical protein